MKKETIVLFAGEYDFTNDDGTRVHGITVNILSDLLNDEGQKGYRVAKMSLPLEYKKELKSVPCLVEADFDFKVNSKMETSLTLVGIKYIKDYPLVV